MKIVLNNQEMESMKGFMDRYMKVCIDTYCIFDEEEATRVSSMSLDEKYEEIGSAMPWFKVEKVDMDNNYHLDIDSKLFALYMESINKSMDIVNPYTYMAIMTTQQHRESLVELPNKLGALKTLINKPMVMKGVTFVCNMLGIKDYVFDMIAVGERLLNNKATKSKLETVQREFHQGVIDSHSLADMGNVG